MSTKQQILLDAGTNEVEFLRIGVGTGRFGINVAKICQILTYNAAAVAAIPGAPYECIGTTYFRDKPIMVYDLHRLLKTEPVEDNPRPLLLVCEFNSRIFGFLIGQVYSINRCSWGDFTPIGTSLEGEEAEPMVLGTVRVESDVVMILDLESMIGKFDRTMRIDSYEVKSTATTAAKRSGVRIVYCEDSEIVSKLLIKTLSAAGFTNIRHFSTGKGGLDFLSASDRPPVDLIISDIEMPQMDGLTLCKQVRELSALKSVPFIVFSSTVNEQTKAKCTSVGATAAFSKPELQQIVTEIDSLFSIEG